MLNSDMKKFNLFTQAKFEQKLFYPKKCVNCNISEFVTKQRKMYCTKKYEQNKTATHL